MALVRARRRKRLKAALADSHQQRKERLAGETQTVVVPARPEVEAVPRARVAPGA